MKNKKGDAYPQIIWILRIIFWIIVIIAVYGITSYLIDVKFQPWQAEADGFALRTLYSPNGISYFDPLAGKVQPGTIDLARFKSGIWEESVYYGEEHLAAKMTLWNKGADDWQAVALTGEKLLERYYQKDLFNKWEDLSDKKVAKFTRKYYVLIKDEGELEIFEGEKDLEKDIEDHGEKVYLIEKSKEHLEKIKEEAKDDNALVPGLLEIEIIIKK
ncbi:hypothetical protein ACFLZB_01720 [Nanoarchaeota archaeon]